MYNICVEGLKPGDIFTKGWFNKYKVIHNDHTGSQQRRIITLDVQKFRWANFFSSIPDQEIIQLKYKINTYICVIEGPTYDWRKKLQLREKRGVGYCKHCGQEF